MSPLPSLLTCSYGAFTPGMGVPVRTSIGQSRWWQSSEYESCPALMPFGGFGIDDPERARRAYRARLYRQQYNLVRDLSDLAAKYPGWPLVLLCFEADRNQCHRLWAAEWLRDRYGIDVPEAT